MTYNNYKEDEYENVVNIAWQTLNSIHDLSGILWNLFEDEFIEKIGLNNKKRKIHENDIDDLPF